MDKLNLTVTYRKSNVDQFCLLANALDVGVAVKSELTVQKSWFSNEELIKMEVELSGEWSSIQKFCKVMTIVDKMISKG